MMRKHQGGEHKKKEGRFSVGHRMLLYSWIYSELGKKKEKKDQILISGKKGYLQVGFHMSQGKIFHIHEL